MFDHKFGAIFLKELVDEISYHEEGQRKIYEYMISEYCNMTYGEYFKLYFPKNKWYKFDDVIVNSNVRRRIYTEQSPTIYR